MTNNCGHNSNGDETGKQCQSCTAGLTYNDKTTGSCKNCRRCTGKKVPVQACSLTSNTVCKCPSGTYEGPNGECMECSYCCGSNWEQSKNIVAECQNQGLGRCVCSKSSCSGTCSAPTTAPKTTPKMTTTAPIITRRSSRTTSSKQTSRENRQQNPTQGSIANVIFKSSAPDPNRQSNHRAKKSGEPDKSFFKPGWIVLFCSLPVAIIVVVVLVHKRARKQISGRCCGKYGELTTEGEATSVLVEGRYEEPATADTANNATPIPPWEEPVPAILHASSNGEDLCCSCRTERNENEQMQCACTIKTSETTLDQMDLTSSSAETISQEFQHDYKDRRKKRQSSPCHVHSSHSRLPSPQSDHYCVTSNSSSNCSTPSPPRGRSPVHSRVTPPLLSTCVTPCQPYLLSPERLLETSFPNSTCATPSSVCGGSPDHRREKPSLNSLGVAQTPSHGLSSESSSLSSLQSHSNFSEDQEICNQSSEFTQGNELHPIPVSVEVSDKDHDQNPSAPARKNTSSVERRSPKAKKSVTSVRKNDLQLPRQTEVDKEEETSPSPTSARDKSADGVVMTINRNDIKTEETGHWIIQTNVTVNPQADRCKYRPIQRNTEHRCHECCPQPDDSFFQLINRERLCLKDQICRELGSSYKALAISARVGQDLAEFENSLNPAERVLDRIKASFPETRLNEFEALLRQIERLDIVQLIQDHHLSCTLCQRNRFDWRA